MDNMIGLIALTIPMEGDVECGGPRDRNGGNRDQDRQNDHNRSRSTRGDLQTTEDVSDNKIVSDLSFNPDVEFLAIKSEQSLENHLITGVDLRLCQFQLLLVLPRNTSSSI